MWSTSRLTSPRCALVAVVLLLGTSLGAQISVPDNLLGRARDARFENGHYRQAGIAFDVPAGWTYNGTGAGETPFDEAANWTDPQTGLRFYAWVSVRKAASEQLPTLIANAVPNKTRQRAQERYQRWQVRPDSVQRTDIGGHPALMALADYVSRPKGDPKVEYLAWIFTPQSRVIFSAATPPEQLTTFQPVFERIVRSATLP